MSLSRKLCLTRKLEQKSMSSLDIFLTKHNAKAAISACKYHDKTARGWSESSQKYPSLSILCSLPALERVFGPLRRGYSSGWHGSVPAVGSGNTPCPWPCLHWHEAVLCPSRPHTAVTWLAGQLDKDGFVFSSATSFRLLNTPGCVWSGWIPNSEDFPEVKKRYSYGEARARLNPGRRILHMRGASGKHLALDTLWIAFFC